MTHGTTAYTDSRSEQIEANLGRAAAEYADRNLAGWVLDLLADSRVYRRGPFEGRRQCDISAHLIPAEFLTR